LIPFISEKPVHECGPAFCFWYRPISLSLPEKQKTLAQKILFITPPFTQLNTPYPATAYLKGFLNTKNISSHQADLGIEVILDLFSQKGLTLFFEELAEKDLTLSPNAYRIYNLRHDYLKTIDAVILFLQNKNPTLAHSICDRTFLPEASRFHNTGDLDWAFGTMGIQDKARHLATLYLEDLGDLIKETTDPYFGFSRYAERLGRTATHFDELLHAVQQTPHSSRACSLTNCAKKQRTRSPHWYAFRCRFRAICLQPFKCGQYIKQYFPKIKIALGGGYANTELRSLSDPRVFQFLDFVCLDDGEASLYSLIEYLDGKRTAEHMKRVYLLQHNKVVYCNDAQEPDVAMKDTGTPDYSDLPLHKYLSVIEVANPMHRLVERWPVE
jgi:hypothetical protein